MKINKNSMFKIFRLACVFFGLMTSCIGSAKDATEIVNFTSNSTLDNIENKIDQAFIKTQIQKKITPLNDLEKSLLIGSDHMRVYWRCYLRYYQAIFYTVTIADKKACESVLKDGIKSLEDLKGKNSEDYALLGLLQNFSTQFVNGMQAGIIAQKAKANLEKSLKLNKNNMRAHCVLGLQNYYTPEEYGGKKKVESHLKTALSLPRQTENKPYFPSWGKNMAYETLVKYYLSTKNYSQAKTYLSQALEEFPNDYLLNSLEAKMN